MASDPKQNIKLEFYSSIYNRLLQEGFLFESVPDFREAKHGNLKFTDDRLTLKISTGIIFITLEHYFIRRENWHALYWGLQSFDYERKHAIDPDSIPQKEELLKRFQEKLQLKTRKQIDLSLIEQKYGWFAWIVFKFCEESSDLNSNIVDNFLENTLEETSNRFLSEFLLYIYTWKEIIEEIGKENKQ